MCVCTPNKRTPICPHCPEEARAAWYGNRPCALMAMAIEDAKGEWWEEFIDPSATGMIPGRCFLDHEKIGEALLAAQAERDEALAKLAKVRAEYKTWEDSVVFPMALVNAQAEDHGLWFAAQTASEAYLQQALRKLHAAVEDFEKSSRIQVDRIY